MPQMRSLELGRTRLLLVQQIVKEVLKVTELVEEMVRASSRELGVMLLDLR
jgi:hypothetical protein